MTTRRVVVDDTDSGIQYTGSWFQANGQNDNLGNFGPPFQRTSHGVNEHASLSYTFNGTAVSVLGTSQVYTVGGTMDPSWECFIDNVSIGSKPPLSFAENNWVFCEAGSLSDSQHTITLRATVRNQNTFWFDRIVYSPSSSVNLDSALILVNAGDPAVTYGPGWQLMRDIGTMTLQKGAKATVDFSGTSLKWFSLIPDDQPLASTSATYSVDGGAPVTFLLAGLAVGAMEPYNQLFFEASGLSAGKHRIEVVHGGNSQTTPLSLNYMVIQNAPDPAGSSPSTPSSPPSSGSLPAANSTQSYNSLSPTGYPAGSTSTPDSSSSSAEHKGAPIGAIVGGVVGGVIVLIAAILLLLLLRRQRKRNSMDPRENPSPPTIIQQFNTGASASFPAGGQLSAYPPVHGEPNPGGQTQHMHQYPSQSTLPTGPPISNSSVYSYSQVGQSEHSSQYPSYPSQSTVPMGPPISHSSVYSYSPAPGSLVVLNHSTPANSTSQLLGSSKAREAGEAWAQPGNSDTSTSHPPSNTNTSTSKEAMRHEDSGIRLSPPRESAVELPPMYTPM